MAHPTYAPDRHPTCKEKFRDLLRCQTEHPIANLWGVCHDQYQNLVKCCRAEKAMKRTASMEKAKQDRERLIEKIKKRRENEGDAGAFYAPGYGVGAAVSEEPLPQ